MKKNNINENMLPVFLYSIQKLNFWTFTAFFIFTFLLSYYSHLNKLICFHIYRQTFNIKNNDTKCKTSLTDLKMLQE